MGINKLGVLNFFDAFDNAETAQFAQKIERLGYSALWVPEALGREIFSLSSYLLNHTERLIVGTGVAIAFSYEPIIAASATKTLGEFFPDRFILGLGVSNKAANTRRGVAYQKPVAFMRNYLAAMKTAPYVAPLPQSQPPVLLAAMMPKMLQLAASETSGTLTYFTTTEQVAGYRKTLGSQPWLCAAQAVILETDATRARARARRYMQMYLAIDHYLHRLRGLGFGDADFANGGSDRLVDAIVAWGDEEKIRERIAALSAAGATHVCIVPINPNGGIRPDERAVEALAPQ